MSQLSPSSPNPPRSPGWVPPHPTRPPCAAGPGHRQRLRLRLCPDRQLQGRRWAANKYFSVTSWPPPQGSGSHLCHNVAASSAQSAIKRTLWRGAATRWSGSTVAHAATYPCRRQRSAAGWPRHAVHALPADPSLSGRAPSLQAPPPRPPHRPRRPASPPPRPAPRPRPRPPRPAPLEPPAPDL